MKSLSTPAPPPQGSRLARFLHRYARRYVGVYGVGAAFLLLTNYINVLIPGYVKDAIDGIEARAPRSEWLHYTAFIGGLAIAVIATRTLSRVLFFNPGRTIEFRFKNDYFAHLMKMAPAFFQRMRIGELISRGTNDMMAVRSIIGFGTLQLLNITVMLLLTVTKMAQIDLALTLYCALPFVVGVVVLRAGVRALLVHYREGQQVLAALSDTILDAYSGVAVLQGFDATAAFATRFDADNDALVETTRKLALVRAVALPVVSVIGSACLVLLLVYGGGRVIDGALTLGDIAAYAAYIGIVVGALQSVGWVINSIQRGLVSLGRVYDVLDEPPPAGQEGGAGELLAGGRAVSVQARDLDVIYPDPRKPDRSVQALHQVRLRVPPGGTLGVFGPTGAGKTSLVNALSRVLLPAPGTVLIDDLDILEQPRRPLRNSVAVVPQEAYLFSRTLRENIGFADLPEDIDEARVAEAVRLACLQEEVAGMPEGLDTRVGERGVTLSGGQRQRVALARAFYRDFRVLLLDDVLSAVDHRTEKRLIEAIRSRSTDQTCILVSHRISALLHADWVVVVDGGRVVDQGTHEQLASRPGLYAETWAYQQEETDEPDLLADDSSAPMGPQRPRRGGDL